MGQIRFSPGLIAGVLVALFLGISLYLRIVLPYDHVFVGDWIKFTGVDVYYHMRIVDNLVHNFPHLNQVDPYMLYPSGMGIGDFRFFDYLLAGIIWLVGLGSPSQHTTDVVGVYFPAILGALTVIPVYFIGKALFNRWAGVIAAGLIAILPGEFLGRSILGFTDHHSAEVLFTTTAVLFLILALKAARRKQLTFNHLKCREWSVITRPLVYSLLAGLFLGIYLLSWLGALLFVFIIFVYFVIQFIVDHLRGEATDYLCVIGVITFLVALIVFVPMFHAEVYLASLVIAFLTPAALSIVSRLMRRWSLKPAYYPLTLFGLGLAGLAVLYIVSPHLLNSMLTTFSRLNPVGAKLTTLEVQPLLFPGGEFSLAVAWGNFTTGFFLSFLSLGILVYLVIRQAESNRILFLVWSLAILAATLSMRRFAYYYAVNVVLLTGYFSWLILRFAGFRELATEPLETPKGIDKRPKPKKDRKGGRRLSGSPANMALGAIVVLILVFYPNIGPLPGGVKPAVDVASHPQFAPSNAWCESLSWMKDNTPDPFGDPDFYYELYETPLEYPDTAYGVAAWWDYGYWIARIGHRIPNCSPGSGGRSKVARFFLAQDEASANESAGKLGSRYVIVDHEAATTKFHGVTAYGGSSKGEFYDVYYQRQEGRLAPVLALHPEYYRSLLVRLYNFDGRQVIPQSCMVVSLELRTSSEGESYEEITGVEYFSSYEQAEAYVATQESGNYRIIGDDPFVSPVPLEALEDYQLVHSSDGFVVEPNIGRIAEVKIFEYTGPSIPLAPTLVSPGDGSVQSSASVDFQWDASSGANKYWLEVNTDSAWGVGTRHFFGNVGNVTTKQVTGFPNIGTTYYWRVHADNDAGWCSTAEANANSRNFINGTAPPPAPTLVSPGDGSVQSSASVDFQWDASSGANKYWLEVNTDSAWGVGTRHFFGNVGNVTTKQVTGFPNIGTTYYWRVHADNDAGWCSTAEANANSRNFINGTAPPPAPTLVSPGDGSVQSSASVDFQWDASSGANKYWLEVNTDPAWGVGTRHFFGNVGNVQTKEVTGFPNIGTTYYWRAMAGGSSGWGSWSSGRSFINGTAPPPAPTLTSPANGATVSGTSVTFTWEASTGATKYWLEVNSSASWGAGTRHYYANVGTATSKMVTGFPNDGTVYYWRAWAGNAAGWSAPT